MSKPNILIFMTDQQRGDSITNPQCLTPNMDKFRKQSVTFTNAFCPSPHCCPSRATFFTGVYPTQHGIWHNVGVTNAISRHLNEDVRLWSEDFAEAGYDMQFSGKWHVSALKGPDSYGWNISDPDGLHGFNTPRMVWDRYRKNGYQEKTEREDGEILRPGWNKYVHYGEKENPFNDMGVVEEALEIIRKRTSTDTPWCQYVGPLGPHDPYFVPQKFLDMYNLEDIKLPDSFTDTLENRPNLYKRTRDVFAQLSPEEHRKAIRHYLAFCTYEDYLFGLVIDELEKNNQLDNTLIIFTSDHGDYCGEHGLWCKGLPNFKGAYHVPMVIGGAGIKNPGRINDEFISLADYAPTFLELAGIENKQKMYGKSLVPFLNDEETDWRDYVYTQSNGNEQYGIQRSVWTKEWKYTYNGFDYDELYNLSSDPDETINLINDPKCQDVVKQMCKKLWQIGDENDDNCVNPYIMVGFAPYGPSLAFTD